MSRYSTPRVKGRHSKPSRPTVPPAKPDNRQWETDLGNGFVRVDNGAPPARLPTESQPVSVGELAVPQSDVPTAPPVSTVSTPVTERGPMPQPDNWRRAYGLGK